MRSSCEQLPIFTLSPGVEAVNFSDELDTGYVVNTAVAQLREFALNSGQIQVRHSLPETNVSLMFEKPTHFLNYPRNNKADTQPWDVIVIPESGLRAEDMAHYLAGSDLQNTRYIFPADGAVLTHNGFSSDLPIAESIAEAIVRTSKIPYYELRRTPIQGKMHKVVNRWIGAQIIGNLNKKLGELPATQATPQIEPPKTSNFQNRLLPGVEHQQRKIGAELAFAMYAYAEQINPWDREVAKARQDWEKTNRMLDSKYLTSQTSWVRAR